MRGDVAGEREGDEEGWKGAGERERGSEVADVHSYSCI